MDIRTILSTELSKRKKRNPRYSLRMFARSLGVHSSTLSRVLKGSRIPTAKLVDRMLSRIDIDPSLKSSVLLSLYESRSSHSSSNEIYQVIDSESLQVLDGWHYFAILSAFEIKGFQPKSGWLSRYLALPIDTVEMALRQLESRNLVRRERGAWKLTGVATTSSRSANAKALEKIHQEYILKASEALKRPQEGDDISGITMAISKKKLPEAIRRIQDFRRSLADYLCVSESDNLDEVYRLNIQLFSLKNAK